MLPQVAGIEQLREEAEQTAVLPFWPLQEPAVPPHDHDQGPVPKTALALPVLHRLAVGFVVVATPLATPQTPLIPSTAGFAEKQFVVAPLPPPHMPAPPRQFQLFVQDPSAVSEKVLPGAQEFKTPGEPHTPAAPVVPDIVFEQEAAAPEGPLQVPADP